MAPVVGDPPSTRAPIALPTHAALRVAVALALARALAATLPSLLVFAVVRPTPVTLTSSCPTAAAF